MTSYKLTYFEGRGRAEPMRLLFAQAGVKYEDIRVKQDQWPEFKASGKPLFGQLPILEYNGTVIAQSGAIFRFIADQTGLSPSSNLDKARADMVIEGVLEIQEQLFNWFFREKDEKKKEEKKKDFFTNFLPKQLGYLEKILKANNDGNGFFIGNKVSSADIMFFALCNGYFVQGKREAPEQLKGPLLDLYNRVMNLPNISAWMDARPHSEF